jgi:uncharacterized protein (DUF342 family)
MQVEGLSVSEADGQIFLRGHAVQSRAAVDHKTVLALLQAAQFGDCVLDDAGIARAAELANGQGAPFTVQVALRKDASVTVEVAPDAMSATLSLTPARGGQPASIESVLQALSEAGVSIGVNHSVLVDACNAQSAALVTIAEGSPPVPGTDSDFTELVPQASNRAPKVNSEGLIDYREHGALQIVEVGTPLMRRIPAVFGKDGRTVVGQRLAAEPVRDEPFAATLKGATTSAQDPNLLVAASAGVPVRIANGVEVEPLLRVSEVNLSSGNLYFDGSIQVDGDVIADMKVIATGDIHVGGTVESGQLEANGNIRVRGGVIAQSSVRAQGAIQVRFAEVSTLHAGSVLVIEDSALGCELHGQNQIQIGLRAPSRGRLIGGSATTRMLLSVPVLGSSKSGVTRVAVGSDPEMERRYQLLNERIATEKANEENLHKLCNHLVAIRDPKGLLDRAKTSWKQAVQTWGKSLAERSELDKLRDQVLLAQLEVGVETEGAVELSFGATRLTLRKEYSRGTFSINQDARIVFTGPDGKAYPAN